MRRSTIAGTFLCLSLVLPLLRPVAAEEQFETLDPGPLPAVLPAKPTPVDWRREAPAGDLVAQITELAKRRPPTGANRARLRRLRATLRPMLPPPEAEQAMRTAYEQALGARRRQLRSGRRTGQGHAAGGAASVQSVQEPAPGKEFLQVKASPVYLQQWPLAAGHEYTIETRDLSAGSDTVLYVARDGRQLALNNDRAPGDPSSLLRFTPPESGDYVLIVRALDDARAGTCDLFIDGQVRQQGIQFAGAVVPWSWKAGDWFQTAHLPSTYARPVDTVLFAFNGFQLVGWDDDGGIRGCSALGLKTDSTREASHVLVGSFSQDPEDADWVMLYRNALSGPDTDGDGLADSLELSLGTNPKAIDTDGDGLRDDWELFGLHTPAGDEDLPSYAGVGVNSRKGSDPRVPDVFLEIDWMAGPKTEPHLFRPLDAALELVTRQFWSSGGVVLHTDLGQMGTGDNRGGQVLPYQESFDRTGTDPLSLERCYTSPEWFAPSRRHLFAYIVCGSRFPDRTSSGHMVRFNEDGSINEGRLFDTPLDPGAIVSMGTRINGSLTMEAGTLMHELGHCLNLQHGGFESFNNFKPNYVSSMNYLFQMVGLDAAGTPDYSHGGRPTLDERALDETTGIGPTSDFMAWVICRGRNIPAIRRREDIRSPEFPTAIDWDGDGQITAGPVQVDFNGDSWFGLLRDNDDWAEVHRPRGGTRWVGVNAGVEEWTSRSERPGHLVSGSRR